MYAYRERVDAGVIQIEPEWGGWYSVTNANADRLRSAAALGTPGMTEFFKVIDDDKLISTFSVWTTDPTTGATSLKPWEPAPAPTDPRLVRAMQLGYGPNPTPEMLDAADQGIAYEDWRAQKLQSGTPAGTATATFGVGGPTSQPTAYPAPIVSTGLTGRIDPNLIVAQNTTAEVKSGPENLVEQTPTGGTAFNFDALKTVPTMVWVLVGVLVAFLVLNRK